MPPRAGPGWGMRGCAPDHAWRGAGVAAQPLCRGAPGGCPIAGLWGAGSADAPTLPPRSGVGQRSGVLPVPCGTCPTAQPWGRTAPRQPPGAGRASRAGVPGALGAGTVPVPPVAWPRRCPQCQRCSGDGSRAGLMIEPRVTPRPPGAVGEPLLHARDREWDRPHPNGVPPGLPGKLRPRGAVGAL